MTAKQTGAVFGDRAGFQDQEALLVLPQRLLQPASSCQSGCVIAAQRLSDPNRGHPQIRALFTLQPVQGLPQQVSPAGL